jgi:hypothetical protein
MSCSVATDGNRGRRQQSARRRQELQAALAAEHPGQEFLVGDRLRHPDPLDDSDGPAIPERQQPEQGGSGERRRLGRRLFRSQAAAGEGRQLGADDPWQGLVDDLAPLRAAGAVVQSNLAARRHRAGAMTRRRGVLSMLTKRELLQTGKAAAIAVVGFLSALVAPAWAQNAQPPKYSADVPPSITTPGYGPNFDRAFVGRAVVELQRSDARLCEHLGRSSCISVPKQGLRRDRFLVASRPS